MDKMKDLVSQVFSNHWLAVPTILGIVVGAVASIAIGFRTVYEVVVTIGARI